jgi:hypothetical protein
VETSDGRHYKVNSKSAYWRIDPGQAPEMSIGAPLSMPLPAAALKEVDPVSTLLNCEDGALREGFKLLADNPCRRKLLLLHS